MVSNCEQQFPADGANVRDSPRAAVARGRGARLAMLSDVRNTSVLSSPVKLEESLLQDFVHSVAHELREPLRTIGMFSELLMLEVKHEDNARQYAQLIVDGVRRMSSMLEGLYELALSEGEESGHALDLTRVVSEAALNLKHASGVSDAVITVGELPFVEGNERQLLRVLQNLIGNAIKYRSSAPLTIQVAAERRGGEWVISVRDNGIGIAPEYQAQIFQLFSRLHGQDTSGAGIGLAICRKLIEGMGGTIWVESAPDAGSVFFFTLAAAQPAAAAEMLAAAATSDVS